MLLLLDSGFIYFRYIFLGGFCFVFMSSNSRTPAATQRPWKRKKTNKPQNKHHGVKRNVAFLLFLYIRTFIFCTIWLWMKNFCGVTLDVLLCVLNRACLPAVTEYTALSQLSRAHVVVNYLLCFDQTDITRERFNKQQSHAANPSSVLLHSRKACTPSSYSNTNYLKLLTSMTW